ELATLDLQKTINSVDQTLADVKTFSTNLNTFTTNLNNTALELDRKINGKDNSLGLLLNDRSLYDNINSTIADADSLVIDLKAHPKRYVHFSVFGRKEK
ncbi:MAG: MCE family protein, partial [Bacteroidaceae bacterium]|nr:MCE family protein [Bacteroidaceae bacterium]